MSSIWGKVVGGATGMMFGGPLGAIFGATMGHWFYDKAPRFPFFDPTAFLPGLDHMREQARQSAFALAVVTLSARMARLSGQEPEDGLAAFLSVAAVPAEQREAVATLYLRAYESETAPDALIHGLGTLFGDRPQLLEEVLDALSAVAVRNGPLTAAEDAFLRGLAERFGLPPRDWERVRAGVAQGAGDPYAVLGVAVQDDEATIRGAYRRLLREHHPDRLMAEGLPAEFVEVANRRMAAINAAWDDVCRRRGFRK